MPASSKAQWKLMKGICQGTIKGKSISRRQACEYISSQPTPKGLPKRKKKGKK